MDLWNYINKSLEIRGNFIRIFGNIKFAQPSLSKKYTFSFFLARAWLFHFSIVFMQQWYISFLLFCAAKYM